MALVNPVSTLQPLRIHSGTGFASWGNVARSFPRRVWDDVLGSGFAGLLARHGLLPTVGETRNGMAVCLKGKQTLHGA
jgi:hypothetical protein